MSSPRFDPFTTMAKNHILLPTTIFLLLSLPTISSALTDQAASYIAHRQLTNLKELDYNLASAIIDLPFTFPNPRLRNAYIALQAWKLAVYSDPNNMMANWVGPEVCNYTGVYCAPALDDPDTTVVAGIDLNHGDIAGYLPSEFGLLNDTALIHLNSNRFCGVIPNSFAKMNILYELDLSNNRFVGPFPEVVLGLTQLKFLDLRFNNFEGELPPQLFQMKLDALFLNSNRFTSALPETFSESPASVIVVADNEFGGCVPPNIGKMSTTLNEIVLQNNGLSGCLTPDFGLLKNVTVLDLSRNEFVGELPEEIAGLKNLVTLDLSYNKFIGRLPEKICEMPSLMNFSFSHNYFRDEPEVCQRRRKEVAFDDRLNCLPNRELQRSGNECKAADVGKPFDCSKLPKCSIAKPVGFAPPPLPSPPVQSPPPSPPVYSPPPPPPVVHSLPPSPPVYSPPPPPPVVHSPPPPRVFSPPPPAHKDEEDIILPPHIGFEYASPPPPTFSGY